LFELEPASRVLSLCNENALSVSQLSSKIGGNHARLIELARELQARALLNRTKVSRGRGRPRSLLRTTALGEQFVEEYDRLLNLRLHCNDNDIKKGLRQADLARRLLEQHVDPYARFQEVNELATNIARTAQTSRDS